MSNARENETQVVWSGEHWLLYLRRPGEDADSGSVSLYRTRYSAAGEGTTALVGIDGPDGFAPAICTDNRELAGLIKDRVVNWEVSPFAQDVPVVDATFARIGDVRTAPSWRIETDRGTIEATWSGLEPAFVMDAPLSSIAGTVVSHAVLVFTREAGLTLDGRPVAGRPYLRKKWRRATGRPRSSCCFSLAETMVQTG